MSCECSDIHLLCHDDAEFPDVLNYHCVIHQQACWEGSGLFSCDDTGFETDKLNLCKRASAQFIQRVTGRACCRILRTASSCRGPVLQWFVNLQTFLCQVMSMKYDSIEKEKNPLPSMIGPVNVHKAKFGLNTPDKRGDCQNFLF